MPSPMQWWMRTISAWPLILSSVVLDQVELPQRRRHRAPGRPAGDQLLQLARAALAGQADAHQVAVDVEVLVLLPPGAGRVLHHPGAELEIRQQVLLQALRRRGTSQGPSKTSTPTIIIRLPGESMRSQAVSTGDMRSRRGALMAMCLLRRAGACRRG
jgi:hypothetical protein